MKKPKQSQRGEYHSETVLGKQIEVKSHEFEHVTAVQLL